MLDGGDGALAKQLFDLACKGDALVLEAAIGLAKIDFVRIYQGDARKGLSAEGAVVPGDIGQPLA